MTISFCIIEIWFAQDTWLYIHRCSCCLQDFYGLVPYKMKKLVHSSPCDTVGYICNHIYCSILCILDKRGISFRLNSMRIELINSTYLMIVRIENIRLAFGFLHFIPHFFSSINVVLMSEISGHDLSWCYVWSYILQLTHRDTCQ